MSESLRTLKANERLWVNRSGCSWQMSDLKRFAQVAHDKWANEPFAQFFWLKSYFLACFIYVFWFKKMSDSLIPSLLVNDVSESHRSLTKNEECERIAQVAYQKWANEQIACFFEQIAHSLRKPMSEFPALTYSYRISYWMDEHGTTTVENITTHTPIYFGGALIWKFYVMTK